ncbi:unnamed protein product, partial [Prorocentrum cordatum]
ARAWAPCCWRRRGRGAPRWSRCCPRSRSTPRSARGCSPSAGRRREPRQRRGASSAASWGSPRRSWAGRGRTRPC